MEFLGPQTFKSCFFRFVDVLKFHGRSVSLSVEDLQGITGKNAPPEHRLFFFLPTAFENGIKYSKRNNYLVSAYNAVFSLTQVSISFDPQPNCKYEKQLPLKTGNSYLSCSNSPRGSTENQEIPNFVAAELSLCAFGICNLKFFYAT